MHMYIYICIHTHVDLINIMQSPYYDSGFRHHTLFAALVVFVIVVVYHYY